MSVISVGADELFWKAQQIARGIDHDNTEPAVRRLLEYVGEQPEREALEEYLIALVLNDYIADEVTDDRSDLIETGALDLIYVAMEAI